MATKNDNLIQKWLKRFQENHLHCWPSCTMLIGKAESGGYSVWKEEYEEIVIAAKQFGYEIFTDSKSHICFINRKLCGQKYN